MPSATDATWLKTLGRLPWWRTRAYAAKQSGNRHAKPYEFDESEHPREGAGTPEGGQFAPAGGGGAGPASEKGGEGRTGAGTSERLRIKERMLDAGEGQRRWFLDGVLKESARNWLDKVALKPEEASVQMTIDLNERSKIARLNRITVAGDAS